MANGKFKSLLLPQLLFFSAQPFVNVPCDSPQTLPTDI